MADGEVVTLWNPATGRTLHDFGHTYLVGALAFAPDGKSLISGASYTDRLIHRWNANTGELLATWRGHTSGVYALAMSPDGKRAISTSYDRTCRLWEVATGRELGQIGKHAKAIWSADLAPDGRSVATVENDRALLWPLDGKKPLNSFTHNGKRVMQVAFSLMAGNFSHGRTKNRAWCASGIRARALRSDAWRLPSARRSPDSM